MPDSPKKSPEPAVHQHLEGTYDKKETAKGVFELGKHVVEKFTNKDFVAHTDDKAHAPRQYRLIAIPSPDTKLLLGERVTAPDQAGIGAPFGYPGISLATVENAYTSVKKVSVFQSTGAVTVQSGEKWTQFATDTVLSAKQRMTFASGQMFIIAAGPGKPWAEVGPTGAELKAPELDTSDLAKQLVKQYALFSKYSQKSTIGFSAVNVKVGLPKIPLGKLTLLQAAGLWLYHATEVVEGYKKKIEEAKKKVAGVKAKVTQVGDYVHKAENLLDGGHRGEKKPGEGGGGGGHSQGHGDKHSKPTDEGGAQTPAVAGGEKSPAASAPGDTQTVEYDQEQVNRLIKEAEIMTDDADRAIQKDFVPAYKKLDELGHKVDENAEGAVNHLMAGEYEAAFESALAATQGSMDIIMGTLDMVAKAMSTLQTIMTNAAFRLLYDTTKPRLVLTAKTGIDQQTDGDVHSYATKGFDFYTDSGAFLVHAEKSMALRSAGVTDVISGAHMLIRANSGAELAAHGSVFIGSRSKMAEVLAKEIYIGCIAPAASKRATEQKDVGGSWTPATQAATETVHIQATKTIVSKANQSQTHEATKEIVIHAGVYQVVVKDDKIVIGKGKKKGKEGVTAPEDDLIEIDSKGIHIRMGKGHIDVVKDNVRIGDDGTDMFVVNGSNKNINSAVKKMQIKAGAQFKVDGPKILLG